MDEQRFDQLARTLAIVGAPRRRVVRGSLGAVAVVLAAGRVDVGAAATCGGDSCDGTGRKPCGATAGCLCFRSMAGGFVCGQARGGTCKTRCCDDDECPSGSRCVVTGRVCCRSRSPKGGGYHKCVNGPKGFCVPTCPQ
jgi:hypothetical protein